MRHYHDPVHSDGYTYRLIAEDRHNPLYGKRISIWRNHLYYAVEGIDGEEEEEEEKLKSW
jgi:hypothetical protein